MSTSPKLPPAVGRILLVALFVPSAGLSQSWPADIWQLMDGPQPTPVTVGVMDPYSKSIPSYFDKNRIDNPTNSRVLSPKPLQIYRQLERNAARYHTLQERATDLGRELAEKRGELRGLDDALNSKLDELESRKRAELLDISRGMICTACKRTVSQLRREVGDVAAHLRANSQDGKAQPLSAEEIQRLSAAVVAKYAAARKAAIARHDARRNVLGEQVDRLFRTRQEVLIELDQLARGSDKLVIGWKQALRERNTWLSNRWKRQVAALHDQVLAAQRTIANLEKKIDKLQPGTTQIRPEVATLARLWKMERARLAKLRREHADAASQWARDRTLYEHYYLDNVVKVAKLHQRFGPGRPQLIDMNDYAPPKTVPIINPITCKKLAEFRYGPLELGIETSSVSIGGQEIIPEAKIHFSPRGATLRVKHDKITVSHEIRINQLTNETRVRAFLEGPGKSRLGAEYANNPYGTGNKLILGIPYESQLSQTQRMLRAQQRQNEVRRLQRKLDMFLTSTPHQQRNKATHVPH